MPEFRIDFIFEFTEMLKRAEAALDPGEFAELLDDLGEEVNIRQDATGEYTVE